MTRANVRDWKVESIFRDLKLKGIEIDENLWLKTKFMDFQEKEDEGMRSMSLFPGMVPEKKMASFYEFSLGENYEGPSCSMLEQIVRRSTKDKEASRDD